MKSMNWHMARVNELIRKVIEYKIRAIRAIGVIRDSDKRGCVQVYQHFTKLNHTS